ncbi:MAG: ECF transporter S component [Oscillospiraceae bacterium]|nr:ECF transporter S component [Oscillospiraceae bacterium]
MEQKNQKTRNLVTVGLMAALVFIFTYIHIDIPTPLGKTMLHLGNVMCILGAFLFGKKKGALAAGIGSMFYDLFDPAFIAQCWITFILKFAMAWVAGAIAEGGRRRGAPLCGQDAGETPANGGAAAGVAAAPQKKHLGRSIAAALCGALTYVALYLGKTFIINYWIYQYALETVLATMVTKGTTSLVNALIAVAASVALNSAVRPALEKAGLADRLGVVE